MTIKKPFTTTDSKLSESDKALFRVTNQQTIPLKQPNKVQLKKTAPTIRAPRPLAEEDTNPIQLTPNHYQNNPVGQNETVFFSRTGLQKKLLQDFRQGQLPIEAALDLHGYTVDQAEEILASFIKKCLSRKLRCIKIIHGKGFTARSEHPILKNQLVHWLPQITSVLAYCSALPRDGGAGAVYVLLKRTRLEHHVL